ncbi:RNA-binding protein 6 isoform X2 [Cololabis saira]|uniref:RNA-binding protein 6 isoform X2 n=1 Tax=Cololabis saira TaxID=129043 RepID=UPI002AD57E93|nr:RNA-binding protein 6 isoform X2 [Cololabis saira]
MWEGPRGGPPFRGDHRGEMFGWRNRPMPDYRGRDGMNMGPMGHGPRPDGPPMDMRRMDVPPMRGHDMDLQDMRRREPNRNFFRPGEEDFGLRRHNDKMMNSPGFQGPGRNSGDNGGRGMPPREPNRFMDMRDRESFHQDMQRFDNPNDGRRGFIMERDDGFRDMCDRPPMGFGGDDHPDMDSHPRERRMMDTDRRGGPPFNPRGRFDSDMDFRNRPGQSADFRGRDRSPSAFGKSGGPPGDRGRSEMPSDVVDPQTQRPAFMGPKDINEREYSGGSPLMDYRSGEEMTLAEEWKKRQKDKSPLLGKSMEGVPEPGFPAGFHRDVNIRDSSPFPERDRGSFGFPGKDVGFPHGEHFPGTDMQSVSSKGPKERLPPEMNPQTVPKLDREDKPWLGERDSKYIQKKENRDETPPYHMERNKPSLEIQKPNDRLKGMKDLPQDQGPSRDALGEEQEFQGSSAGKPKDQDYRDIDYRTGPGRVFEYNHEELQAPEKLLEVSQPITPSKFTDSGSQDQDYRNASVDKVSSIISITGIPKTATTDQILGAFAVRDGVPIQGMKIKNVVPGYSYDMAYVEFLNLEDAVHFMESNKGSLKVGARTASMKYIKPDECERGVHESDHKVPQPQELQLPRSDKPLEDFKNHSNGSIPKGLVEQPSNIQWQRSSDLTPEAWQQQIDQQLLQQETEQQAESWGNQNPLHHGSQELHPVFKDSKTMIIKNVKPTTTVETILKALDPFAYLDERNVRLVKGKPLGKKRFCFVDMDSHEQVTRLVELLTKPKPLYIDGVRVYAEVAKPLRNQSFIHLDKPYTSILGHPPDAGMMMHQPYQQPPPFLQPPVGTPSALDGELMRGCIDPALSSDPSMRQDLGCVEPPAVAPLYQTGGPHVPMDPAGMTATPDVSQTYIYGSEIPDTSNYLYDSTSGFYYDPETTLYYDPNSRYFYNAQTQDYLYWDATSKTYIPVPGGYSADTQAVTMTAEDQAILSNPAADAPLEMKKLSEPADASGSLTALPDSGASSTPEAVCTAPTDKKEDDDTGKKDKEDKPRSLAAVKIMKDMERWAKIQNRQKESVRAPSPVLKFGIDDDKKQSKSADAGFAVFERKISGVDDLFKKPLAPSSKKDEKSKRPMGSLGLLASDYAAGSDEEVEEDKEEAAKGQTFQSGQAEDKEDKLTDWKKMACLLCRRQFPNKDALVRHQQLSDLHKQNMEIHLKIKRSKKELEALENQEREVSLNAREPSRSPEPKRRKHHHPQPQPRNTWAGSSREMNKASERPGLGSEPIQKKKEPVVWDHNTYKQAVRKAMFARFKELE